MSRPEAITLHEKLVPVCTSCLFLFGESFYARDSLVNATAEPWRAEADFASGKHDAYLHPQGGDVGYQRTGRGEPMPVLTNIVLISWSTPPTEYSLSNDAISKLRTASGGKLWLILYEEGLACMSPSIKKAFGDANRKKPYNSDEYLRMLRNWKNEALAWTREVLGK